MQKRELIQQMKERVERCRLLAASITDAHASTALSKMADDGDLTIVRLQAEDVE